MKSLFTLRSISWKWTVFFFFFHWLKLCKYRANNIDYKRSSGDQSGVSLLATWLRELTRCAIMHTPDRLRVTYLRTRITIVVMTAARNTKPPKTPRAMMPPVQRCVRVHTSAEDIIYRSQLNIYRPLLSARRRRIQPQKVLENQWSRHEKELLRYRKNEPAGTCDSIGKFEDNRRRITLPFHGFSDLNIHNGHDFNFTFVRQSPMIYLLFLLLG